LILGAIGDLADGARSDTVLGPPALAQRGDAAATKESA